MRMRVRVREENDEGSEDDQAGVEENKTKNDKRTVL